MRPPRLVVSYDSELLIQSFSIVTKSFHQELQVSVHPFIEPSKQRGKRNNKQMFTMHYYSPRKHEDNAIYIPCCKKYDYYMKMKICISMYLVSLYGALVMRDCILKLKVHEAPISCPHNKWYLINILQGLRMKYLLKVSNVNSLSVCGDKYFVIITSASWPVVIFNVNSGKGFPALNHSSARYVTWFPQLLHWNNDHLTALKQTKIYKCVLSDVFVQTYSDLKLHEDPREVDAPESYYSLCISDFDSETYETITQTISKIRCFGREITQVASVTLSIDESGEEIISVVPASDIQNTIIRNVFHEHRLLYCYNYLQSKLWWVKTCDAQVANINDHDRYDMCRRVLEMFSPDNLCVNIRENSIPWAEKVLHLWRRSSNDENTPETFPIDTTF